MNITIVGLGVIGGSFAMAFKEAGFEDVYAVDLNQESIAKAKNMGIIKDGSDRAKEFLEISDLVIICIYPRIIKNFMVENRDNFKDGAIVTDVAGIKGTLIKELDDIIPDNIDFIFGHPMAGRENKGIDHATAQCYKGANYLLIDTERNDDDNVLLLQSIIYKLGFKRIIRISSDFHDQIIAFTSHLPHVMAVSLINSDVEARNTEIYMGGSYRDATRVADINEDLWTELFLGNRENLLEVIDDFMAEMSRFREDLAKGDRVALNKRLKRATKRRRRLDK
ncbi:prephenate dehydrogenase [Intestinibacter bartlettii]|uniref:Prephenate dehydrogenase n=1 Tax=Intestinibacter bartlettii TaxID=261299 RepID=A0ABS6DXZ1_9FIRM|nr:prephenate dehydrogenase [Intestinibacter bartlettii]MBU5336713.1 prephenate dehydrogenase [Intestinibacter bartlettii]